MKLKPDLRGHIMEMEAMRSVYLRPQQRTNIEVYYAPYNNILNIPLEAGTLANEYLNAYEHVLNKLKEFQPEFILFSAGFGMFIVINRQVYIINRRF